MTAIENLVFAANDNMPAFLSDIGIFVIVCVALLVSFNVVAHLIEPQMPRIREAILRVAKDSSCEGRSPWSFLAGFLIGRFW